MAHGFSLAELVVALAT
ncbi:prepilin-type N-terminal cleavage/methylation domain-containing protein [Acidocella sp.]